MKKYMMTIFAAALLLGLTVTASADTIYASGELRSTAEADKWTITYLGGANPSNGNGNLNYNWRGIAGTAKGVTADPRLNTIQEWYPDVPWIAPAGGKWEILDNGNNYYRVQNGYYKYTTNHHRVFCGL